MALVIRERCTFLHAVLVDEREELVRPRRGSSLPPPVRRVSENEDTCCSDIASESTEAPRWSDMTDHDSVSESEDGVASGVVQRHSAGERSVEIARSPLRSSAQAYCPSSGHEIKAILTYVQGFLCGLLPRGMEMTVAESGASCQIGVLVPRHVWAPGVEWIMEVAQSALVSACSSSPTVHLIGVDAQPFVKQGEGSWEAKLCVVPPCCSEEVCWDSFQCGQCSHRHCRWRHPETFECTSLRLKFDQVAAN